MLRANFNLGIYYVFILGLTLILVSIASNILAVKNTTFSNSTDSKPAWMHPPKYQYSFQVKPDPFQPFINSSTIQDKSPKDSKLTPLERVQPTQLKLVGVLWEPQDPDKSLALVELPNGKGYVLRKGTQIGFQKGKVIQITPKKIAIKEEFKNVLGEKKSRQIILKLHKQAGDNND